MAVLQTDTDCRDVLRDPFGDGVYLVKARTSLGQRACDLINEYGPGKAPTKVNTPSLDYDDGKFTCVPR
jgi:hypothetical protein